MFIVLAGILLASGGLVFIGISVISRMEVNLPESRKLADNVCLYFFVDGGASQHAYIATTRCDNLLEIDSHREYFQDILMDKNDDLLSFVGTMNCPSFKIEETSEQIRVTTTVDPICDFFEPKNPLSMERVVRYVWLINKSTGNITEVDKVTEVLTYE